MAMATIKRWDVREAARGKGHSQGKPSGIESLVGSPRLRFAAPIGLQPEISPEDGGDLRLAEAGLQ